MNELILKRFNGVEKFAIEEAELFFGEDRIWIEVHCTEGLISPPLPDSRVDASPMVEAFFEMPENVPENLVGIELRQIESPEEGDEEEADEDFEDSFSSLYYYQHVALKGGRLKFLAELPDGGYQVSFHATTEDVNFYDGSKPDTVVEFTLECDINDDFADDDEEDDEDDSEEPVLAKNSDEDDET